MARRNPASPDDGPARAANGARRGIQRFAVALGIVVAIAVVAVIVFLHVTGAIGPGSH